MYKKDLSRLLTTPNFSTHRPFTVAFHLLRQLTFAMAPGRSTNTSKRARKSAAAAMPPIPVPEFLHELRSGGPNLPANAAPAAQPPAPTPVIALTAPPAHIVAQPRAAPTAPAAGPSNASSVSLGKRKERDESEVLDITAADGVNIIELLEKYHSILHNMYNYVVSFSRLLFCIIIL